MIGAFKDQIQDAHAVNPDLPPGSWYIRTPRGNALTIWQDGTVKELGPHVGDREAFRKAVSQPSMAYDTYLADRTGYEAGQVFVVAAFAR